MFGDTQLRIIPIIVISSMIAKTGKPRGNRVHSQFYHILQFFIIAMSLQLSQLIQ